MYITKKNCKLIRNIINGKKIEFKMNKKNINLIKRSEKPEKYLKNENFKPEIDREYRSEFEKKQSEKEKEI